MVMMNAGDTDDYVDLLYDNADDDNDDDDDNDNDLDHDNADDDNDDVQCKW